MVNILPSGYTCYVIICHIAPCGSGVAQCVCERPLKCCVCFQSDVMLYDVIRCAESVAQSSDITYPVRIGRGGTRALLPEPSTLQWPV